MSRQDVRVSKELRVACETKISDTILECRKHTDRIIPVPALRFCQIGRTAGIFQTPSWKNSHTPTVIINPDFFTNHYDSMMHDTLPHEVAHHVSRFLYGLNGGGHGTAWKSVMKWLGIPAAERCHSYSLEGVKVRNRERLERPYKYSCSCQDHWVTDILHRRMQHGQRRHCKRCHSGVTYKGRKSGSTFIPSATPIKRVEGIVIPAISVKPTFRPELKWPDPKPIVAPIVKPVVVQPTGPQYRVATRFINGTLQNVRELVTA